MSQVDMQKVIVWDTLKKEIAALQIQERALRVELAQQGFEGATLKEGTNRCKLPDHKGQTASLVLDNKIDRKVDEASLEAVTGIEGKEYFADLIRWKPELKAREYKSLSPEDKVLFDQCLVIKPANLPTIKFELKDKK